MPSSLSHGANAASRRRHRADLLFQAAALGALIIALASLGALLADLVHDGAPRLSWQFLTNIASRKAEEAGIYHALAGSIWVIVLTAAMALPVGVAAAVYLEEYGGRSRVARFIEINISNLAAVPSIIYGLLGLGLFVRADGHGPQRDGRRRHAGAAGAARRDPLDARGAAHRARHHPRGLVRARRHQVADHLAPGAPDGGPGHPDRPHPRRSRAPSARRRRSSPSAR